MAGYRSDTYQTHELLAQFSPERLSASETELLSCIDAITERVTELGESATQTPALTHGIHSVLRLRQIIEHKKWPMLMVHDQIGFELTHNLGGLGLIEESR